MFGFLYKWHVHGFFFLALASRGLRGPSSRLIDIFVRFLVPFILFLTLATLARALTGSFAPLAYLRALAIGNARSINAACDMSLFWFLPAFAAFLILLNGLGALLSRSGMPWVVLGAVCLGCLFVSYGLPRDFAAFVPLGLAIAIYIIPSSIVFTVLSRYLESSGNLRRTCIGIGALLVFLFSIYATNSAFIDISLFRYGQDQSLAVFLIAICASISANVFLKVIAMALPEGRLTSGLFRMGSASLVIFLVHSFIQAPLVKVAQALLPGNMPALAVIVAIAILAMAIAVSLWVDRMLRERPGLKVLILPSDWDSFTMGLKRLRHTPASILRRA